MRKNRYYNTPQSSSLVIWDCGSRFRGTHRWWSYGVLKTVFQVVVDWTCHELPFPWTRFGRSQLAHDWNLEVETHAPMPCRELIGVLTSITDLSFVLLKSRVLRSSPALARKLGLIPSRLSTLFKKLLKPRTACPTFQTSGGS
jgi:hypothetical protein